MKCNKCHHVNQGNTQFCVNCGAKLGGGEDTKKCVQGHIFASNLAVCPYCPSNTVAAPSGTQEPPSVMGKGKTKMIPSGTPFGFAPNPSFNAPPSQHMGANPTGGNKNKTVMIPGTGGGGFSSAPGSVAQSPGGTSKKTIFSDPNAPTGAAPPAMGGMTDMVNRFGTSPLVGFLVSYNYLNDRFGAFWPVRVGRSSIGRGDDVDIRLQSPDISREHAMIAVRQRNDGYLIILADNMSQIGTYCNGEEIGMEKVQLMHGSTIKIGPVEMVFVQIGAVVQL